MIEKTQRVSNLRASLEYLENGKVNERYNYLDRTDDKQIRNLYSYNGKKIDFKTADTIGQKFDAQEIKIYNPQTDKMTIEELHQMAKDIIQERSVQAKEKLGAVYAIHHMPDGSNKHLHIAYFGSKKALKRSGKGKEWINKLDSIELKYTKDAKERTQVIERNQKRMDAINLKYERGNYTNTQKADNFIWKHINKENGHFGWKRFEWALNKSKMSDKQKDYWKQRVGQRLRGLEEKGIAKSIDGQNFKIDLGKYTQEKTNIIENAKKSNVLEVEKNQLYQSLKEIKQEQSSIYKDNQKHFKNLKILKGIKGLDLDKQDRTLKIQMNFQKIEELRKLETKTKIDIIDSTLLTRGEMDPDKAMLKAMTQKYVSLDAIRKNTMLQVQRLEQLKSKGLVTKDGSTYKLAVSREEFLKYKDSPEAAKNINKLTEKILPSSFSKTVKGYGKEVDRWVNKWTQTSTHSPSVWTKPLATAEKFSQEVKKSYWAFKPRSSEERFLAFGLSVALATTKFTLKFATKIAWKAMKETGKAIYQTQKDIKTIHSNHKIISKMQKNQSIGKLAREIKTQERKFDKNYEYKVKPKSKQQEVKNERTR
ncbi:MAG TPA: hypothetical protein ENN12_01420 [Epsilonproteobacteria bacterium]|nr:hypothetical protein [Campylobacterota bacterium]